MANLLIWHNATVTVCHSRTIDLKDVVSISCSLCVFIIIMLCLESVCKTEFEYTSATQKLTELCVESSPLPSDRYPQKYLAIHKFNFTVV